MKPTLVFLAATAPISTGNATGVAPAKSRSLSHSVANLPTIPSKVLHAAFRAEAYEAATRAANPKGPAFNRTLAEKLFGIAQSSGSRSEAEVQVSDLAPLLFPVRSPIGTVTWVMARSGVEALNAQAATMEPKPQFSLPLVEQALTSEPCSARREDKLFIEEYAIPALGSEVVTTLGTWLAAHALPQSTGFVWWREKLVRSLAVLPDQLFVDIVRSNCITHGRRTATGETSEVVHTQALPSETILVSLASGSASDEEARTLFQSPAFATLTIGAERSTGFGLCATRFVS